MKLALITGSSGFLGKYLVNELSSRFCIHTLGRKKSHTYVTDLSRNVPRMPYQYDLVIHAAAKAHETRASKKENAEFFALNGKGTHHLCEAFDATRQYPEQFVFISTVAVYGLESGELINESAPLKGTSAYAKSKINAELFLQKWCSKNNVTLTILRLPLVAGANPPGNLGDMIRLIMQNRYFNIGKGDAKKSVVLAEDVAAIIAAAAGVPGIYNLTDGVHPTMAALAETIAKQVGKNAVRSIPYWLAKLLARVSDLFGVGYFGTRTLRKITATLTFDDSRARHSFSWNPKSVADHFTIN
jgi:nucleoside-diphosphate-sugar epimerase